MSSDILALNAEQFHNVISTNKHTLVYFYTTWCGACRGMTPIFERAAALQRLKGITFCKLNCDQSKGKLERLETKVKLTAYPTVIAFYNGRRFAACVGGQAWRYFTEWVGFFANFNGSKVGLSQHRRIQNVSSRSLREPLVEDIADDNEKIQRYRKFHKHVVVIYHMTKASYHDNLLLALNEAVHSSMNEGVQFYLSKWDNLEDDDNRDFAESLLLQYRPVAVMYRNGNNFSEGKLNSNGERFNRFLKDWLADCLAASRLADSVPIDNEAQSADSNHLLENHEDEDEIWEDEVEDETQEEAISITEITSVEEYHNEISENERLAIVFYDDSPHSRAMIIIFEHIASLKQYEGIEFRVVDCSENEDMAEELKIQTGFTTRLFRNCTEITAKCGIMTLEEVVTWLSHNFHEVSEQSNSFPTGGPSGTQLFTGKIWSTLKDSFGEDDTEPNQDDANLASALQSLARTSISDGLVEKQVNKKRVSPLDKSTIPMPSKPDESVLESPEASVAVDDGENDITISIEADAEEAQPSASIYTSSDGVRPDSRASGETSWGDDRSSFEHVDERVICNGIHEDRPQRSRLLSFLRRRKPFHDPEHGCVFVPTSEGHGLQIGRANEGGSYLSITLWHAPEEDPGKISFGVGFGPDPTVKARFESAVFRVSFGYDDIDGKSHPITVREVFPKDVRGEPTVVLWGTESESSLGVSVGTSNASISTEGRKSKNATYSRQTASRVRGQGVFTSTVEWTFQEDEGKAGRHGLDPQYDLYVVLSTPHRQIWMSFWGKAVLNIGKSGSLSGGRVPLLLGSMEEPYRRNLDLSNSSTTSRQ